MTDEELEVIGEICPRCYSSAFISRKVSTNVREFHCDICGNTWHKYWSPIKRGKKQELSEKKDGLTVGAALGILSLSVFIAGVILSIGAMWMFGLGLFLTLCGFMNFE